MKTIALLSLMLSFSAFAEGFDCRSKETGLRYVVNSKARSVSVYETINAKKPFTVEKITSSTFQAFDTKNVIQFYNSHGAFMEIVIKGSKITGSFDDDEKLVCFHF